MSEREGKRVYRLVKPRSESEVGKGRREKIYVLLKPNSGTERERGEGFG